MSRTTHDLIIGAAAVGLGWWVWTRLRPSTAPAGIMSGGIVQPGRPIPYGVDTQPGTPFQLVTPEQPGPSEARIWPTPAGLQTAVIYEGGGMSSTLFAQ